MASISVYQNYNNQNMGFFGYSKGNTTHGYYNVTFNYDSVTRSGNTITVTNAYVKMANPNNGYTTNYVGVTNVVVGGVDLGISVKESGGKSKHTCQTGTKSSFSFNVSGVTTTTATISVRCCFYASSNINYEKPDRVQTLTGTLSFGYGTMTVTFSGNGGNTPSPSSKTVTYGGTYGTLPTCIRPNANNYSYSLKGWYTASSGGSQITSSTTVTSTGNHTIYAQWNSTLLTSSCGTPTSSISDYSTSVYVRGVAGADGVGNGVTGVEFFVTVDGSTPSTTNYQFHKTKSCTAGKTTGFYLSPNRWATEAAAYYEDAGVGDGTIQIKVKSRTIGAAGSSYYSGLSAEASVSFTYTGSLQNKIKITQPTTANVICGCDDNVITVTWEDPDATTNCEYEVALVDVDTDDWASWSWGYSPDLFATFTTSDLTPGHRYCVAIDKYDAQRDAWTGYTYSRGLIYAQNIRAFSQPTVDITAEGSFPSIKPSWRRNTARMMYLNNGTGNICKLSWNRPTGTGNRLSGYELHVKVLLPNTSTFMDALAKFVGDVNEYYLDAQVIENAIRIIKVFGMEIPKVFELQVEVIAKSAFGAAYDSTAGGNRLYVVNGSGVYVNAGMSGDKPIKKRAIAYYFDENTGTWQFSYDIGYRGNSSLWTSSDTSYEIVTNAAGDPILDPTTNDFIYSF